MQIINLQITPNGVMPVVNASQYDYGRLIQFNLYDGASAYIPPEGTEIRVEGRKSDGKAFSYFVTYVGNAVTVVLTQQMTALAEEVPCELRLSLNNEDIGTLNFTLAVEPSNIGYTVVSETEIPAIIGLARKQELNSEAWANGTRGGVPVSPDDPTYNNNAKYWAEHVQSSLANLTDVDLDDPYDGQIIIYDNESGKWKNATNLLANLVDIALSSPSNGQVLKYNSSTQKWENANESGGGGSSSLVDLSDTSIVLPGNGQVLIFDSATSKWKNQSLPAVDGKDVSYDNTDSGLTASNVQDAIDEVNTEVGTKASTTDVNNKHKVTTLSISTSDWTTDITSQSGTTLYKKQVSLNHVYANPSVDIGAASEYTLPTTAEQEAYDLLLYVTVDTAIPCLYLYASDIPTDGFYINVEGVD